MATEFPCTNWAIFPAEEFETAAVRDPGDCGLELLMQARPNGRMVDHCRFVLGGTSLITAKFHLKSLLASPSLPTCNFSLSTWPADIKIRRNMVSGEWLDLRQMIEAREIIAEDEGGERIEPEDLLETIRAAYPRASATGLIGASVRWAIMVGDDNRPILTLQGMPASADYLNSKPHFKRYKIEFKKFIK